MFGLFKKKNKQPSEGASSTSGSIIENGEPGSFSYSVIFHSVNEEQIEYLISHFQDNDWDEGLSIRTFSLRKDGENAIFDFTSTKWFEVKDFEDWTEEDINSNIFCKLVDKGQFFSAIYFSSDIDDESVDIKMTDPDGISWSVSLEKYPEFSKSA